MEYGFFSSGPRRNNPRSGGGDLKLRWMIKETDHGKYKPDWPKSMSLGKPWVQFRHSKPVLQFFADGKWQDVPTEIIKERNDRE